MNNVRIFYFLCALFPLIIVCCAKRGYILTAPRVLDAGSAEYFTIALFDVPNGGTVTLKLLKSYSNDVIAETEVFAHNNYNTWIQMDIPDVDYNSAWLHITGTFSDGYKINDKKEVSIRLKSIVTFIQTDKPIYKPGQTVRFRILPMDSQLIPLSGKTVGDIWIEDPTGITVEQWKQVDLSDGIVQLELTLSDEPVHGMWNIHTNVRNVSQSQSFKVEEYVLPKFDVVIKPPTFLMADADEISVMVCAKYTYGKKVDGVVHAEMTYQKFAHEKEDKVLPSVEYERQIAGCAEFVVNAYELLLENADFNYRTIKIFAEVVENDTGIVQNASTTLEISHMPLELKFLGGEKSSFYFKPGLPYHGKLKVLKPDGTPATSETINICATLKTKMFDGINSTLCNTFLSDSRGLIKFTIPAQQPNIIQIMLEAKSTDSEQMYNSWLARVHQPYKSIILQAWYSPSQSFLQIEPITDDVHCDRLEKVLIRYTTNKRSTIKFYHQVISRGRIVQLGSHSRSFYGNEAEKKDDDDDDDPYLLKADTSQQKFGLLQNEMKLNKTHAPYVVEFMFSFDARSTMSPVARLLVFYVRDDGEIVADSRTFRITHCFRNQVKLLFRHPQQYPNTEAAMLLSASPSSLCGITFVDKSVHLLHPEQKFNREKVFNLMESFDVGKGKVNRYCQRRYIDDLRRRRRSFFPNLVPRRKHSQVDALTAFEDAGAVVMSDLVLETLPCITPPPIFLRNERRGLRTGKRVTTVAPVFLFTSVKDVKENNKDKNEEKVKLKEEIRSYFPETWLWELHRIGKGGEMALKRELPHTITEWRGEAICVHPKHGLGISDTAHITAFQPFFASFNLPYSVIRGETVSVVISVFNYLTKCLPIKLSLEPSKLYKVIDSSTHHMCVCGESSKIAKFTISPVVLGYMNITVYAYTVKEDSICGNELTAGISARDAVTRQLLVEAEGFPKEETINAYFCPYKTNGSYTLEVDLLLPENVVNGSARAYVSVNGDLMGPALNGLEKLVRFPTGCGEQNMVLFTPNIYILDYLTNSGRVNEEIKTKALDYMRKGYQRELIYRHEDGSYSAFGKKDFEGSMWLTAFVVKSFAQARQFINIDEHDLALSTKWIIKKQLENGCFPPQGYLLNKALQGGLKREGSLAPLAAFILISLLESGFNETEVVKSALLCLQTDSNPSTYTLSLFAYAAALAKHNNLANEYLHDVEDRAIKEDNMMYWNLGGPNSIAINVETSGYVILAMLEVGSSENVVKALPVVRWVAKQRNSNGGFVSTQDTVVALQALSRYSSYVFKEKLNIAVTIESDELIHEFKINEVNQLLMQTLKIPVLPTVVDLQASGEGCALAQFSLKYNVENSSVSDAFDLKIKATRQGSYGCNLPTIGLCMRYKIPRQESNMAVIEVNMVSGYTPDEWSLHTLQNDKELGMKRHEVNGNTVIFYFDQLSNKQKCFHFSVKKEIEVENEREARVRLYDYYRPELKMTTSYKIESICSQAPLPNVPHLLPMIIPDECTSSGLEQTELIKCTDKLYNIETDTVITNDNTSTLQSTLVRITDSDILLADGPNNDVHPDSQLTEQFIDLDVDLSFPGGIEGNQPVSVLPPEDFTRKQSCPFCMADFTENFTDIYCSSSFALRVSVRNPQSKAVKILHDISAHHLKPKAVKVFGTLSYEESCNCTELNNRNVVLIFGHPKSLWKTSEAKHELKLTSNVLVIRAPNRRVQPLQVKTARKHCI